MGSELCICVLQAEVGIRDSPNSRGLGDMNKRQDICIALRTAVTKDEKLYIQAGGGIVFDSDPEAEFQETVNKSKALQTAAKIAGQYI